METSEELRKLGRRAFYEAKRADERASQERDEERGRSLYVVMQQAIRFATSLRTLPDLRQHEAWMRGYYQALRYVYANLCGDPDTSDMEVHAKEFDALVIDTLKRFPSILEGAGHPPDHDEYRDLVALIELMAKATSRGVG